MGDESNQEENNQNTGARYIDLVDKRRDMAAHKKHQMLANLDRSFRICMQNYQLVMEAVNYYKETPDLWNLENRPELDEFQLEFLRLTHNYISSYYSLYEHTQKIKNSLDNEQLDLEYQKKLDEMDIRDTSDFLLRFRAYTQHYELPPLVARVSHETVDMEMGETATTRELVFDREKLLEWDHWQKSREVVEKFDEHVDFVEMASEYQEKIQEFTSWFDSKVRELYSDEFQEYNEVLAELEDISREKMDDDILKAWENPD
jgi:hypothetical protein